MATTTCQKCGETVPAGMNFCRKCGNRVTDPGGQMAGAAGATPSGGAGAVSFQPASTVPPVATQPWPPAETAGDPRNDNRRLVLIAILALILTLIARLVYSAATAEPQAVGEIVAELPVGTEGGSTDFDGDGNIRVPAGALDKEEVIRVRKAPIEDRIRVQSPQNGAPLVFPAGTVFVYIFEPFDLVFQRPVTITLPVPPGQDGLVFLSTNGNIVFLDGTQGNGTISVRVTSFAFNQGQTVVVRS